MFTHRLVCVPLQTAESAKHVHGMCVLNHHSVNMCDQPLLVIFLLHMYTYYHNYDVRI